MFWKFNVVTVKWLQVLFQNCLHLKSCLDTMRSLNRCMSGWSRESHQATRGYKQVVEQVQFLPASHDLKWVTRNIYTRKHMTWAHFHFQVIGPSFSTITMRWNTVSHMVMRKLHLDSPKWLNHTFDPVPICTALNNSLISLSSTNVTCTSSYVASHFLSPPDSPS